MAILKDVQIYYVKCDPKRPNPKYNKTNPTWEVQLRTSEKAVKAEWEKLGLQPKPVMPDDGDPYWRLNLRKKSIKLDKTPAGPVVVVDGQMNPMDPNTIGNGSVANVRVFQYEFTRGDGSRGIAAVLMGIQVTKYIKYEGSRGGNEDFEDVGATEVVEDEGGDDEDFAPTTPRTTGKPATDGDY